MGFFLGETDNSLFLCSFAAHTFQCEIDITETFNIKQSMVKLQTLSYKMPWNKVTAFFNILV